MLGRKNKIMKKVFKAIREFFVMEMAILSKTQKIALLAGWLLMATLLGCALFKGALRTANDLATVLCNTFAEEHEEQLEGLSPKAWCGIHDHLAPFIDVVLRSEQTAGIERSEK